MTNKKENYWRAMKYAPKNGTVVLLLWQDDIDFGEWCPRLERWINRETGKNWPTAWLWARPPQGFLP